MFLLLLSTVLQPVAADPHLGPWLGSWTLVSAQSSIEPPDRLSITPVADGMHIVMSGQTHLDFTTSAKSKDHKSPAPGNLGFNQIELHTIDKRHAEVKEEKDGAVVATVREQLSKDANELTTTTVTRGQPDKIIVWVRHGGARNPKDPFIGDWTQDQSKTRMQQDVALKIEPDGNGGVHFLSDFSYTARFDGKPYALKNSRNDTVTLQLVDPHTVIAVYRRDEHVAQTDTWTVSADGLQMTLSSTGTMETGQRVTEKLVFKKQ